MAEEKGQTITIGADTSQLDEAIKESNKIVASLIKAMKELDAASKLDPDNIEVATKKYNNLREQISEAENKLETLRKKEKEYADDPNADKKSASYKTLVNEIEAAEAKLVKLGVQAAEAKNEVEQINDVGLPTFVAALEETTSKTDQLADGTESVANGLKAAGQEAVSFGKMLMAHVLSDVIVNGIKQIASTLGSIAKDALKYNIELEKYTTSITAILKGNKEAANTIVDSMKEISSKSAFDLTTLLDANQMLLSVGITAEGSAKVINSLAQAVAYTGGGNDELKRMVSNLQQIKNAGKATAADIKQFAYAGIDIYGILSAESGKTTKQLKAMDITYSDIRDALYKATSEGGKYFGALEIQAETLSGQVDQLKSNFKELTGEVSTGLSDSLKNEFLPTMNSTIKDWKKMYEEHGIQGLTIAITDGIANLEKTVSDKLPELLEAGSKIIVAIVKGLIRGLPNLITNWDDILWDIIKSIGEIYAEIVRAGVHLIEGLWEGIKSAWGNFKTKVGNLFSELPTKIKGVFGIHSPSTVMRDEVGKYLVLGIGEGIEKGMPETMRKVNDAMATLNGGIQASVNPVINPTANSNPIILNIENFNNNRATDIQALAEELEFYRKNVSLAYGGN